MKSDATPQQITLETQSPVTDWIVLWNGIKKARSIHASDTVSGAEFLVTDRESHLI